MAFFLPGGIILSIKRVSNFIRAEGLIPRPSGAKPGVLNPTAIPYENTIPCHKVAYCSAAGLVIWKTGFEIFPALHRCPLDVHANWMFLASASLL